MPVSSINIGATVGAGTEQDFQQSVHLTIYWAQDMVNGPICQPVHPSVRLADRLRRALPVSDQEIATLEVHWPPDDWSLDAIPHEVPLTDVTHGRVSWLLTDHNFRLRKHRNGYLSEVIIQIDREVRVFQTVQHPSAPLAMATGVPRNLKLISAVCGLYDGNTRLLPIPTYVDTEADVEAFLLRAEDSKRQLPIIAIAVAVGEPDERWRSLVAKFAHQSFALQHVVGVTEHGLTQMKALGWHRIHQGAIKTYYAGFDRQDDSLHHPMTGSRMIQAHGRWPILQRLHTRLMDSNSRRLRKNAAMPHGVQ